MVTLHKNRRHHFWLKSLIFPIRMRKAIRSCFCWAVVGVVAYMHDTLSVWAVWRQGISLKWRGLENASQCWRWNDPGSLAALIHNFRPFFYCKALNWSKGWRVATTLLVFCHASHISHRSQIKVARRHIRLNLAIAKMDYCRHVWQYFVSVQLRCFDCIATTCPSEENCVGG